MPVQLSIYCTHGTVIQAPRKGGQRRGRRCRRRRRRLLVRGQRKAILDRGGLEREQRLVLCRRQRGYPAVPSSPAHEKCLLLLLLLLRLWCIAVVCEKGARGEPGRPAATVNRRCWCTTVWRGSSVGSDVVQPDTVLARAPAHRAALAMGASICVANLLLDNAATTTVVAIIAVAVVVVMPCHRRAHLGLHRAKRGRRREEKEIGARDTRCSLAVSGGDKHVLDEHHLCLCCCYCCYCCHCCFGGRGRKRREKVGEPSRRLFAAAATDGRAKKNRKQKREWKGGVGAEEEFGCLSR